MRLLELVKILLDGYEKQFYDEKQKEYNKILKKLKIKNYGVDE